MKYQPFYNFTVRNFDPPLHELRFQNPQLISQKFLINSTKLLQNSSLKYSPTHKISRLWNFIKKSLFPFRYSRIPFKLRSKWIFPKQVPHTMTWILMRYIATKYRNIVKDINQSKVWRNPWIRGANAFPVTAGLLWIGRSMLR